MDAVEVERQGWHFVRDGKDRVGNHFTSKHYSSKADSRLVRVDRLRDKDDAVARIYIVRGQLFHDLAQACAALPTV